MTHPSELKIIEIATRYLMVSVQANQAYQTQQKALELDLVLTQQRLQTPQGTAVSLAVLAQLVRLTQVHKAAFQTVLLASSGDIAAVTAELPKELRERYNAQFLGSTQWQLDAQSRFYANREHWITTAVEICTLIESRRHTCTFGEHGVDFHDADDFDRFDQLMERLNDAHYSETQAYAVRMERMRASLEVLGMTTA